MQTLVQSKVGIGRIVIHSCGCLVDHGVETIEHPDPAVRVQHMLDYLRDWYAHPDPVATLAHAATLTEDDLHAYLKSLGHALQPRILRDCSQMNDAAHAAHLADLRARNGDAPVDQHIATVGLTPDGRLPCARDPRAV